MSKICVVGAGYVGLSLAVLLAKNNEVNLVEIDENKLKLLRNKISPLREELLEQEFSKRERLKVFDNLTDAIDEVEYLIIATPTNYDEETNKFDTSSIESVLEVATKYDVDIIIKSTIPVGYTKQMCSRYNTDRILFSPEFLREGKALTDNMYPSRIIVGGRRDIAERFSKILEKEALNNPDTILMGTDEAEAIKLFSNTYLAMRVSFFNELDSYAMCKGLDVEKLLLGVSLDPRIGDFYNNPSFGYGGYCLPKDTKQLRANFTGVPNNIISAIVDANSTRKKFLIDEIIKLNKEKFGIYKLAMKKGSDNYRSSSIIDIIYGLKEKGKEVVIFDNNIKADSIYECKVEKDFDKFVKESEIIVTNRFEEELKPYEEKVFTRDIFRCDE